MIRSWWTSISEKADEVEGFYTAWLTAFNKIADYLEDAEGADLETLLILQESIATESTAATNAYNSAYAAYVEAVAIQNDELDTAFSQFNTKSSSITTLYISAIQAQ